MLQRRANSLLALGVVGVDDLAGSRGAALGTRETLSATLSPWSSTASLTGTCASTSSRGRDDDSRQGSRGGGSGLFLGRLSAGATATSTALPDSGTGHREGLAAAVDAKVGIGVGGLVTSGQLWSVSERDFGWRESLP